jgi:uncharacterized protein (TIGR03435 family)
MAASLVLWETVVMKPAILLLIIRLVVYGQPSAGPPRYEVASIKANSENDLSNTFHIEPDGSISAAGITLRRLMMTAYNVQGFRILGGPDWVNSRRWVLQAKPDGVASPGQIRPMLRALLEERFRLRTHSEIRKLPVYELVVDHKGSKVPTTKDTKSTSAIRVAPGSIQFTNATSAAFAGQLSYALGHPVIDKTNLLGNFDFALVWTPEPGENGGPTTAGLPPEAEEQPVSAPDRPSIFAAIPEQLGLRLKSARGPVEVVVVDNVQMPTAN